MWMMLLCFFLSTMQASATNPHKKRNYKKILNEYCNYYLSSCFGDVQYVDKSIWIVDISAFDATHVLVKGHFAYRDYSNKKHRAIKFQSIVESEETEVQRITFKMQRPSDITHTQPYWVECSKLFGKTEQQLQEKKFYTDLLNEFCAKLYSQCFPGRRFENNSIKINGIQKDEDGNYAIIQGTHNYIGRNGTVYRNYKFEAKVQGDEAGDSSTITFNKEAATDMLHSNTYWEQCTKTFSRYDY